MPVLDTYNYSFLSVPAVWVLGIVTHFSAAGLAAKSKEIPDFDNVAPRQCLAEIQKLTKTSKVSRRAVALAERHLRGDLPNRPSAFRQDARRYVRTESAQQNVFENIGLYAAAIVAGNVAGLSVAHMNKIALGYLASRVIYVARDPPFACTHASVRSPAY